MKSIIFILFIIFLCWPNTYVFTQVNADFVYDKDEGCGSLAVNFKDQSTTNSGSIVDWKWNMGGVISSKQNPGIIFTTPGLYTICLTIKTSSGATSSICKDKIIKVYEQPIANFSVDQIYGCKPLFVSFTDLSSSQNGNIVSWTWDIGGSANVITTSDKEQPINTSYSSAGSYTGTLSITDIKGCKNIITKPNIIQVAEIPKLHIDYTFLSSCALPWDVSFTNIDPDPSATYKWDFGNGQTFFGANPDIVTYSEAKKYTIQVVISKGPCNDTIILENLINTSRTTDFFIQSDILCEDQAVRLRDTSNYVADSLIWDFGDGKSSKENHPQHIYSSAGCYVIKLTKYIGNCIQMVEKPCINIMAKPDVTFNILNEFSCMIPANIDMQSSSNEKGQFFWHLSGVDLDTTFNTQNQQFVLDKYGNYNVNLTFIGDNGCKVQNDSIEIDIVKFEANLPFLGPSGCVPYDALLADSIVSNTPVIKWQWDIGNPIIFTSAAKNPVFPVSEVGRWDLRLMVENIYGCRDTILLPEYIRGGTKPIVDFGANPLLGCLDVSRQFISLCSSNADFWIWSQNGAFFSFEKNPEYVFPDFGVFDIGLTAIHNGCSNSLTKEDFITVYKPKSAFKVDYNCDDPYTINITNQSVGADSLYWVINLSTTTNDTIRDSLLSTYTFPGRGLYFLTHYAKSFETGCEHIKTDSIFIVDLNASYTMDTIRGCAPLDIRVSTIVQDAISSEFLPGEYAISKPLGQDVIVTFNQGGILKGPEFVVMDRHGCKDTFQTNIPIEVSKINAKIGHDNVICVPGTSQFMDQSTTGLGTIIQRHWSLSDNNQSSDLKDPSFDFPSEGNYTVGLFLQDSWGCTDSVQKEILAVFLVPGFSADTISCTAKEVRLKSETDNTFVDAYLWNFGDGTISTEKNPLHQFSQQGVYDICVEMFDSRGCSKSVCKDNYIKIVNPTAAFSGDPLSAPCPPLLTNFLNESKIANKFTWNFGDNSGLSYNENPSHVYTLPGSFDVVLYAEMLPGCVDTLVKNAFVNLLGPKADMDFNITGNCLPLEVKLSAQADKLYTFIWDYGDGKINEVPSLIKADTTVYFYDTAGKYIPKLLVSDESGCSRTFTIDPIIVNDIQSLFVTATEPLCGLPAQIEIENMTTSSSNDLNFKWLLSGGLTYTSSEKDPAFTIESYGKYTISLISSTTNCIDTLIKDSIIEVAAIPDLSFTIQTIINCENTPLFITNTSEIAYGNVIDWIWDFGNGSFSNENQPEIVFTESGLYQIKVKAITDKGCIDSTEQYYNILPNTLLTLSDNKTICLGDSIDISAKVISSFPDYTFHWTNNPDISCLPCENVNVKPSQTTSYFFETESQNGCTNKDSVSITVIPIAGPSLVLSADTIVCQGGSIEIFVTNVNPNYDYQWDTKDVGLNCYDTCTSVTASPLESTYYSMIVRNMYGCFKEDSILVNIEKSIPDFLIPSKTICEGASTILEINGGFDPTWSSESALSCSLCRMPIATPLDSQTYYVDVTSAIGCHYKDSILINVIPLSSIDAGEDVTICKGEQVILEGNALGSTIWSSNVIMSNQYLLSISSQPNQSTTYILQSISDECTLLDSVVVNVINKTEVTAIGDTICPATLAQVSASGSSDSYIWYKGDQIVGNGDTLQLIPEETVKLHVIGTRGLCQSDTSEVVIYVYPPINYTIHKKEYEVFLNSKVNVEASYDKSANYNYLWSPSSGLSCADCPEPSIKMIENSINYKVEIVDEFGCTLEDQVFVRFRNECNKKGFYIPNIFTPNNGDGSNDIFRIYAENEEEFLAISIFDRWGNLIFEARDINETWNGIYQGRPLSQGVYTYIVTAKCPKSNEIYNFAGDVTLIN